MTRTDSQTSRERNPLDGDAPVVDSHAHIFTRDLPIATDAWTRPDYGYSAEQYLATLDEFGIHFGVLSGISISGHYNDYMIEQLRRHKRLRGTVIIAPDTERYILDRMKDDGIVGVRFQFTRRSSLPDLRSEEYQLLLRRIRDLDWHVHIALEGRFTPDYLAQLEAAGVKIVIDHFGHPEPQDSVNCKGFQAILRATQRGRTWVKLSSAFRLHRTEGVGPAHDARGEIFGAQLADVLLREAGPERLLWGSDCPFVGWEATMSYADTLRAFASFVPSARARRTISDTALKLYFS